jgi:uncharacterized membrane protein
MKTIRPNFPQTLTQQSPLLLFTAFCMAMLLVRAMAAHSLFYFFLVWNLFLAWTPFAITTIMKERIFENKLLFYPAFLGWLLLLPNAPYLITDFVHLGKKPGAPVWFDVLLLISFAMTGLLYGLASMKTMHNMLIAKFNVQIAGIIISAVCFLSGFGVYLGRVLRYNSWDVLHSPFTLAGDILYSLIAADTYRTAWGITLGFGTLLYLLYSLSRKHHK